MSKCDTNNQPEPNNWTTPDEKFIQMRPAHSFVWGNDSEYPTNSTNHRLNRLIWEHLTGVVTDKDELITELLNDRRTAIQVICEQDGYIDILEDRNDIMEEASKLRYR